MRYYYQWQNDYFLEGTDSELARFHQDYPPSDTKLEAVSHAIIYFEQQRKYYQEIADRMKGHKDVAENRLNNLTQSPHSSSD